MKSPLRFIITNVSILASFFTILLVINVLVQLFRNPMHPKCRYHLYDRELAEETYEREMRLGAEAFPHDSNRTMNGTERIVILLVVEAKTEISLYRRAMSTMQCYAQIHGYDFKVVSDKPYSEMCPHKDKFFRRHCVAAIILDDYDYMLYLDADVGVVNPNRTIQEFIDDRFDVTVYDRFYNQEVAAGSYLVKNTQYAKDFLNAFANYEVKQNQNQVHGTDNGGLHAHLAEFILGEDSPAFRICLDIYDRAKTDNDLFGFEACIRASLGNREDHGKIRIMRKGTGWMRDGWLTFGTWNPRHDFMIHGWKENQFWRYNACDLPIDISFKASSKYFYPIQGEIDLDKCHPENTSWSYDINLVVDYDEMEAEYSRMKYTIDQERYVLLSKMTEALGFH